MLYESFSKPEKNKQGAAMEPNVADMLYEMRWNWLYGERIAQRLEAEHSDDDIKAVFYACKIFKPSLETVFDQRMIDSLKAKLGELYLSNPSQYPRLRFALKAKIDSDLSI